MLRALSFLAVAASLLLNAFGQSDKLNERFAVIISVEGKGYYSTPGVAKGELRPGISLPQGSKIWTEADAHTEVYFRQIGSILRLVPQSEATLERLTKYSKDGLVLKVTVIGLHKGRMLTRPRVLVSESSFVIRTPHTTFSVPGAGTGRYDIRADGAAIVGRKSKLPLKALEADGDYVIVTPGSSIGPDGKVTEPSDAIFREISPQLDELESLAENLTPPPAPNELPRPR